MTIREHHEGATGRRLRKALAAAWLALIGLPAAVLAQSPSAPPAPPTPPTPPTAASDAPPLPIWQPPSAGPGLGVGSTVVVERVRFEGRRSVPEADLQALAAPFLNRSLRGLEIEELRQRITRLLIERGFVSSGALVPDGALERGTLTLRLVEGEVARVQLNGMRGLADAYLSSRLVQRGEALNVNLLQDRFQLLLADPLFTRLNARLLPGDTLGQAVLDIDVTRARPWQLSLFANNHMAPAVGSAVAGIDGSLRNLVGWGDALSGTVYQSDGSLSHDLSWTLPLAARSTTLSLRLARTRSSVIEEKLADLDIDSQTRTREVGLSHPLIDRARQRLSLGVTHALRRNSTTLGGEPFEFVTGLPAGSGTTRVESWRLFQDLTLRLDRHVIALRTSLLKGRNNLAPAAQGDVVPARSYRLWQAQFQAALTLGEADTQLVLRGQMQHSAEHLVPLEQMALGGRHTVRGYHENQLVRDNAYSASAELHWPLWHDNATGNILKLVPFADAGSAWNKGDSRRRLASAGMGLVWTLAGFEAELFLARRLEKRPTDSHGDWQDHGIHIALRYRPF